mmetsp:Transcript_13122/g.41866  ORF Transcript_13122/g.41866 Transcript_13122/m.41866 type:complete len:249 (+) Transcript_13122:356-1102(+)
MTGQGSSPHPAVALSDACGTPAQGPQGGQWWGEAVPAAGRVRAPASAPPRVRYCHRDFDCATAQDVGPPELVAAAGSWTHYAPWLRVPRGPPVREALHLGARRARVVRRRRRVPSSHVRYLLRPPPDRGIRRGRMLPDGCPVAPRHRLVVRDQAGPLGHTLAGANLREVRAACQRGSSRRGLESRLVLVALCAERTPCLCRRGLPYEPARLPHDSLPQPCLERIGDAGRHRSGRARRSRAVCGERLGG